MRRLPAEDRQHGFGADALPSDKVMKLIRMFMSYRADCEKMGIVEGVLQHG